jgi:hypothetical protein
MTKDIINEAQAYLTVATNGNGKNKKILDIEQLLKKHPVEDVIVLLKTYLKEKQDALRDLILTDKTRQEVDSTVAVAFRVTMAIKMIELEKEVKEFGRAK